MNSRQRRKVKRAAVTVLKNEYIASLKDQGKPAVEIEVLVAEWRQNRLQEESSPSDNTVDDIA